MKRHHILKKCLLMTNMLFFTGGLVSCNSSFFGNSESVEIKSVTPTYDEKSGNTIITIAFVDEDVSPVTFLIPRGLSGKDGVGIQDVSAKMSDDKKNVELTIHYTDASVKDTVLTVPYLGISNVEVSLDEETGSTDIVFCYTDGTKSQKISIPRGKDGVGLSFSYDIDKDGNYILTVRYSDPSIDPVSFTIPKPKDAISITQVKYNEEMSDEKSYALDIIYSDGYTENVFIPRPQDGKPGEDGKNGNQWYYGSCNPDDNSNVADASVGDFYIDHLTGKVYQKETDGWKLRFAMKSNATTTNKETYYVYFDPGEGFINGTHAVTSTFVTEGKSVPLSLIPTPKLEGYTFEGWYTDPDNPNSGKFTDMSVVTQELHLQAKYIK